MEALRSRLEEILRSRANHTAFVRGNAVVEFQIVAKVIDVMRSAGISSVGLLTPQLEQGH
jgi:biopolymer transport protein ExbD